ncbi:MAG TPA: hypothetical protein VGS41_07980 [Chthonomonadales bacterium]|nr:hypothetical protein [Chthonomonadales bacterium]
MCNKSASALTILIAAGLLFSLQAKSSATSIGSNCYIGPGKTVTAEVKANGWLAGGKVSGTLAVYFASGAYFTGNFSTLSVVKSGTSVVGSGTALGYYDGRYAAKATLLITELAGGSYQVTVTITSYYNPAQVYQSTGLCNSLSGFVSLVL